MVGRCRLFDNFPTDIGHPSVFIRDNQSIPDQAVYIWLLVGTHTHTHTHTHTQEILEKEILELLNLGSEETVECWSQKKPLTLSCPFPYSTRTCPRSCCWEEQTDGWNPGLWTSNPMILLPRCMMPLLPLRLKK